MSEYRNRTTGAVNTQGEIRRSMPNTSLPRVWTAAICDDLNIDPVLAAPAPAPSSDLKVVSRNGVVQDANGNWVEAWVERDMFADYVNDEGVTVTKAEQEAAYVARKAEEKATAIRTEREQLLNESVDIMNAVRWASLTPEQQAALITYRQELLDITAQSGFPFDVTYPVKPE